MATHLRRTGRLPTVVLVSVLTLGVCGGALTARAASAAHAGAAGARLWVTPTRLWPAQRVRVTVHLRGLNPGSPVEIQVNPPAPAEVVLVDLHTHAARTGEVDQNVAFPAMRPGAYVVFVNMGSFADSRSLLHGFSLEATALVAPPGRFLSFPCSVPHNAIVGCQLSGFGFSPREALSIVYTVRATTPQNTYTTTVFRRRAVADAYGSFTRPALFFSVDPRVLSYRAAVTVTGTRGDSASTMAAGTP